VRPPPHRGSIDEGRAGAAWLIPQIRLRVVTEKALGWGNSKKSFFRAKVRREGGRGMIIDDGDEDG
jgi:hypothetical protein